MTIEKPVSKWRDFLVWAAVGASKADSNHARTAGENGASGSAAMVGLTGPEILLRPHGFARMFDGVLAGPRQGWTVPAARLDVRRQGWRSRPGRAV